MNRAETRQQLVDHYLEFYTLAFAMLHNEEDAKDAVQEALVRTMVKHRVDQPVQYCFQTVRHVAIDMLRHRRRVMPLEGMDVADSVSDNADDWVLLQKVMRLRNELPRILRTLVVLHDQKGYTYDNIAALTGMSKMSVRRRLREAHETMKERIKKDECTER